VHNCHALTDSPAVISALQKREKMLAGGPKEFPALKVDDALKLSAK
jgi:hypothetical protein